MKKLLEFINKLSAEEQEVFANACETTIAYLRKAVSKNQKLGVNLCIAIEKESNRQVLCEDLRPDVNWQYLRETAKEIMLQATV